MDFFKIREGTTKKGDLEVSADYVVGRTKDLMVRGRSFYAVWDEANGLWSQDEYLVQQIVDTALHTYAKERISGGYKGSLVVRDLRSFRSTGWVEFRRFMNNISDNSKQLDSKLIFANTPVRKDDYASKRLPYNLEEGDISAWDELMGTLYSVEERAKIEWAIGSVVAGDSKKIQKFLVLYGPPGTGKSTVLNIIQKLFQGYETTFEAKALVGNNNAFATEAFKNNPLVAIQHDGDLSRIEDNTKLNSIISHEDMTINEKYKSSYTSRVDSFLFMGTNQPVKISDSKSGIIRRLIDVHPTGIKIPNTKYNKLMDKIEFELGYIAQHCLEVYKELGKNYYNSYRPVQMMFQTDVFFNFIEANYDLFKHDNQITLTRAYALYKEFCAETGIMRVLPQYKIREELRNYFDEFKERAEVDGVPVRSLYSGFNADKFKAPKDDGKAFSLVLTKKKSLLDNILAEYPAQYAKEDGTPEKKWENVKTTLADLDTSKLHYVKVPENHIVIDFDLKDEHGEKSRGRNLGAAAGWPPTYAEFSKSGAGIHLHYIWRGGEPTRLATNYSDGIEVKVFTGGSSLRRAHGFSNGIEIADLATGLPLKEKRMIDDKVIKSEKGMRDLIARNMKKEFHPGTKPSVDFIHKIMQEAYDSGVQYDLSDLRPSIIAFANNSSNQPLLSLKVVQSMKFKSDDQACQIEPPEVPDERLVFFDVEVYPNLFVVCWKYENDDTVVKMLNPTATEVEALFKLKLIGFNNRRYDNHILYARHLGYTNEALYELSQKIIDNNKNALFGEAYNLSYTDIYDFSSKKQSLKKFEIELGVHHMELDIPWDKPVPEDQWERVVEYCANDVRATEATFKARRQDFVARQILADLSGMSVNNSTQQHTARIIFGKDKNPSAQFVYTDLSKQFPGYIFDKGKSSYKDQVPSEGGYVYAEPGMYENVAVLDIASMHPTSIEQLNMFGPYTKNFSALKEARIAIKHSDFAKAKKLLDGKLVPYLKDEQDAEALSYALKIVINIVYGLTSAKFENPFFDKRNRDNIVAKRGALFMIDLKEAVQSQGYEVVHIKTDSIKIPEASKAIIDFVMDFGSQYGYTFEHETTYDKFCLVNDAVYIAREGDKWTAVGAQFQHSFVYKTLFSHEELTFEDYCETKQVSQGVMYLDFQHDTPAVLAVEGMHHVGRTGRFVPVEEGTGGGVLYRVKDGKSYAVTGTKGYYWVEAEVAKTMGKELKIDMSYFDELNQKAQEAIDYYGSFTEFIA